MYSFMAVWVHRDTVMLSWRHNVGPFFWRHRLPLQQNNARPHVARNLCTIPGSWSSSTAYILTRHVTHWACLWCPGIGVYKSASCQCPGTLSVALLECIYCLHADDEDEIFLVNYHYRCRQCLYSSSCRMVERHVPSFMSSSLIWLVRNVEAGSVYFCILYTCTRHFGDGLFSKVCAVFLYFTNLCEGRLFPCLCPQMCYDDTQFIVLMFLTCYSSSSYPPPVFCYYFCVLVSDQETAFVIFI